MSQTPPQPSSRLFITGAASGIGAAFARAAHAQGHRLALADINLAGAEALAQALGGDTLALALDVREPGQWQAALDRAWGHFGGLDVLVNNAGIIHTGYARDVALEHHRRTLDVNFMGPLTGMLAALPRFQQQGHGHLLTVCSMSAFVPITGMASYVASKHALRAFHHSLALEERKGPLHFTLVHPPATETPMLAQEEQDDSTAMAFSEKTVTPEAVAQVLLRALDEKPTEVVMPALFGQVLRLFGSNPGIIGLMADHSESAGRKALASRRGKN